MYNIKDLVKVVNSKEFVKAATEAYHFIMSDENDYQLGLTDFLSQLKANCIKMFMEAKNDGEKAQLYTAAVKGDVFFMDITEIFECDDICNAKLGDFIHKATIRRIKDSTEHFEDPMYDELSEYDSKIAKIIKGINSYMTIGELKRGNYLAPCNYRFNPKEIRAIENVKMTAVVNRLIHNLYDERELYGNYRCKYDEIPEDDVLKRFAFHTDKSNPAIEIVFEDGTIVNYLEGDIRVKAYKYQDLVTYTKLCIIKQYEFIASTEDGVVEVKDFDDELLLKAVEAVFPMVYCHLDDLDEVYTRKMIEGSKKEQNKLKQLIKQYNL